MKHQMAVTQNGQPLTILLSCADHSLELYFAEKLTTAGYTVVPVELDPMTIAHRIFQLQAPLLILQTNTGLDYQEEMEYFHLLHCKVLQLESHVCSAVQETDVRAPDVKLSLPVDADYLLGIIQCMFYKRKSTETTRSTVKELLDRWQVTNRQPNRGMISQTILLTVENPHWMMHITKYIYPRLARQHRLTVTAVEQRLRRAINRIYNYGQDELFRTLFQERPSNSVFFIQVARYLVRHTGEEDEKEDVR